MDEFNSEEKLISKIKDFLSLGYSEREIVDIMIYQRLIELWFFKGGEYHLSEEIINFVKNKDVLETSNNNKEYVRRSDNEVDSLYKNVVYLLKNETLDDDYLNSIINHSKDDSFRILDAIVSSYQSILGNDVAITFFMFTALNFIVPTKNVSDSDSPSSLNSITEDIYRNIINSLFLEGYSEDTIFQILRLRIFLMEWFTRGGSHLSRVELESSISLLSVGDNNFMPELKPRFADESVMLTEKFVLKLKDEELDENLLSEISSINKDNAYKILINIFDRYSQILGNKLVKDIFHSIILEINTESLNFRK